jgi:hypothetical protein
MHEVIDPTRKDIRDVFDSEFAEMTEEPVGYEALIEARERLIAHIKAELTDSEKRFLLSIKEGKPNWPLLGLEGVARLPAVQWKLKNVARMAPTKHQAQLRKLRETLGL